MEIQVSTSAGKNKADVTRYEWFKYSGRKVVLDNHHKEYDGEIRKGDLIGFSTVRGKIILVDADDPSIKFTVSPDEKTKLLSSSKPYFGKVNGVKLIDVKKVKQFNKDHAALLNDESVASLRELAKARNAFTKGMQKPDLIRAIIKADTKASAPVRASKKKTSAPKKASGKKNSLKFDPNSLDIGQSVQVNTDSGWVVGEIVEEFDGETIRVVPSKGNFAGIAIRVAPEDIKVKTASKPKKKSEHAEKLAAYDEQHSKTGIGGVMRVRGKDYVVMEFNSSKGEVSLVPVDENNQLIKVKVESAGKLLKSITSKVGFARFEKYLEIFAARKAELNPNSKAAIEHNIENLRKFDIDAGDVVGYQLDDSVIPVKMTVLDVDWIKGRILAAVKGKNKWLPGSRVEYKRSKGGVTEV